MLERKAKRYQHCIFREVALAAKYHCPVSTIRYCRSASRFFHLSQSDTARAALAKIKEQRSPIRALQWNKVYAFIFNIEASAWTEITKLHRVDYKGAVLM